MEIHNERTHNSDKVRTISSWYSFSRFSSFLGVLRPLGRCKMLRRWLGSMLCITDGVVNEFYRQTSWTFNKPTNIRVHEFFRLYQAPWCVVHSSAELQPDLGVGEFLLSKTITTRDVTIRVSQHRFGGRSAWSNSKRCWVEWWRPEAGALWKSSHSRAIYVTNLQQTK